MNRAVIFIFQATVALALSSCVELIDLSPREGRSLVVNCILTESDVQTLEMYYTTQKLGEEGEPVNDAKVTLVVSMTLWRSFIDAMTVCGGLILS